MPAPLIADWPQVRQDAIALNSLKAAADAHRLPYRAVQVRAHREDWPVGNKRRGQPARKHAIDRATAQQIASGVAVSTVSLPSDRLVKHLADNPDVLTLAEKRKFLASIVRTPIGQVTESSPLAQKVKRRTDKDGSQTEEIELPGKLKALELDAHLAGELVSGSAPAGNTNILIQFLGQSGED